MKILIVNYEFPPLGGGGGIITYQIAKRLAENHQIDILTSAYRDLPRYEVIDKLKIYRVPIIRRTGLSTATIASMLSFFPASLWRGMRLLKQNRYDVVNTWFAIPSGPTGTILSRISGIPNVLSIVGGDIYDPTKKYSPHHNLLLKKTVKSVLQHVNKVVALSSDVANKAQEYYNFHNGAQIIWPGIEPFEFRPISREELRLEQGAFYIIAVGRLIKRKGLPYLLKALARIKERNIKVLLIGEGPEEGYLKNLASNLGISHRVDFLGPLSEERKFQHLSRADIFVLPSLYEGFGIVFLEAMYCGLPIITTNEGGQTDFLKDGKTGFLVPPKDVDELARKILILYSNMRLREQISQNNREYVKRFYIENTARKYERLFEEIVSSHQKSKMKQIQTKTVF